MSTNATHTPGPWSYRNAVGAGLQIFATPKSMKLGGGAETDGTREVMLYSLRGQPQEIYIADERWAQFTSAEWDAMQEANAAHIVKCVNSHDALLAACRAAKIAFASWHGSGCRCDVCKQLSEAVQLAEGQG